MNTTVVLFLVFVFSASALVFSQDQVAIRAAEAAYGPKNVKFDAKQDATQHPVPQPAPDQANLYRVGHRGSSVHRLCSDESRAGWHVGRRQSG